MLRPRFLFRRCVGTNEAARCDDITSLHKRLCRVYNDCVVYACLRFDERVYRSFGESHYGEALSECEAFEWQGKRDVHAGALLFQRLILRLDFRTKKRSSYTTDWYDYHKWERNARSRTGSLVPHQCIEIDRVLHDARVGRCVVGPP